MPCLPKPEGLHALNIVISSRELGKTSWRWHLDFESWLGFYQILLPAGKGSENMGMAQASPMHAASFREWKVVKCF